MNNKEIKIENGVIHIDSSSHEIKGYELGNDNPLHCLHLGNYNGEKVDIAIYPDSITIHPKGIGGRCDAFTIKFKNKIDFKITDKSDAK